ncbi:DUF5799 family protein [Haloarculaceae archaeon H-GB2-1]|nr:DUF5799 family protein [Haloarculaceae archaeon H-GB1-1]MEA5387218.1 DUF5799 family protein [Haloarculaceae archaeon H-GB11]MEA5408713.1 DUF5799 family protein [Haloarculaceae archaeon H-GB2-1]
MSDSGGNWTDQIIGERMQLDQEFSQTIDGSQFSRQQWGLIMTAIEFDVEHPDDDERATLVADTSKLPSVMPELDRVANQSGMAAMGGAPEDQKQTGGGLFGGIKSALGLGGGGDDDGKGYDDSDLDAAEELAQQYAAELQQRLEDHGKWAGVRESVQDEGAV